MMRAERLVFALERQLGAPVAAPTHWGPQWPGQPAQGVLHPPSTSVPMDNSLVYLGETCVFDVTLSNHGAQVSALTIKVECSIEGGSTSVLYDNSQSPLQQLPYNAQEQLRVQTDIKEQGLITIVASAVFTDQSGERKYHVQFFKFSSASPVSVRTRVRHLPHIITANGSSSSSSGSSTGCCVGKTRCFLEVNVQNSTQLVMQLHAVRLLAAPGVCAQQMAALIQPTGQQDHHQQQQQSLLQRQHPQHDDQQQQQMLSLQQPSGGKAVGQGQLAPAGAMSGNDIELLHDIDTYAGSSSAAAPSVQQVDLSKQQQQQQQQQQSADTQAVPLPAGCSHNALWQIEHQLSGPAAANSSTSAAAGGAPTGPGSNSSSSSTLGRLELHWSTCDGRTGRLLTQPLTGPVPASGKEVLMQLHRVSPGALAAHPAADAAAVVPHCSLQPQQLTTTLPVNQPFTATLALTAGPHDMGPLLVLYTTTVPHGTSGSSAGSASGGGPASSNTQLATDSSSIQARKFFGAAYEPAGGEGGGTPEVVVQGSRSRRIAGLPAGQSVDVTFELLPLRHGWLRLPTFVVASEADGRLLDGVHDVHILVV